MSVQLRRRLVESGRALWTAARNPTLFRAQPAFGAAWTAEWAFAVALLAAGGSLVAVYAPALLATAAFTVFHPTHSALLLVLCVTPLELTSATSFAA